jgi:homoserine dehydrogenase
VDSLKLGLLGFGTVGSAVWTILQRNAEMISTRTDMPIEWVKVADLDLDRVREAGVPEALLSDDPASVVNHPEINCVIELIGGVEPARTLILQALRNGKHVVTANKALLALHGNELFQVANENRVSISFEASVAGGIPLIKSLREGLAANQINFIAGIVNGTGNFILTEMSAHQRDFDDVLSQAQALGYAEADPSFDIEGTDAAHKLMILAAIAFGIPFQFDRVYTEGIVSVSPVDIRYANELGYVVKHLAIAQRTSEGVELRVHPTLLPEAEILASVNGVMNAVLIEADAVGTTLYYGPGAGGEATGSAVIADLVDLASQKGRTEPTQSTIAYDADPAHFPILPMEAVETGYYLRLQLRDKPGVIAEVTRILGDLGISIEAILQKEPQAKESAVPVILLIKPIREAQMNQAIEAIEKLPDLHDRVIRIRLEDFGH